MLGGLACGPCHPMSLPLWAERVVPFLPPSTTEVGFPFFPPLEQSPVGSQPLQRAYLVPTPLPTDTFTREEESADWPHSAGARGAGKRQAQAHWPSLLCIPAPSCACHTESVSTYLELEPRVPVPDISSKTLDAI